MNLKQIIKESIDDFEKMDFLSEELFMGIHEYGFKYPSPIQSRTIHIVNAGCDLIAQSQSGTGKTGAFLCPEKKDRTRKNSTPGGCQRGLCPETIFPEKQQHQAPIRYRSS